MGWAITSFGKTVTIPYNYIYVIPVEWKTLLQAPDVEVLF